MGSPRVATNRLALEFEGVDYWMDATSAILDAEPCDDEHVLLTMPLSARFLWFFELEGVQSTGASSLWRYLYAHIGQVVPFRYAVHGNTEATDEQPHMTGWVRIMHPPRLGGEASFRGSQSFDMRLEVATPTSAPGAPVAPAMEVA